MFLILGYVNLTKIDNYKSDIVKTEKFAFQSENNCHYIQSCIRTNYPAVCGRKFVNVNLSL
jgi:hypothetical protein